MTLSAVRTVEETDEYQVVEGLLAYGGPFNGKDTYGTFFSVRTDYGLDLHPSGIPVLYNHGFDPDFRLSPIGMTMPTASFRTDKAGLHIQMRLDKSHPLYAARVRPMLDKHALGISQGSAEHSLDIDEKSGEVLTWPLHEVSVTPTEANPLSVITARSAEIIRVLEVAGSADIIAIVEAVRRDMVKVAPSISIDIDEIAARVAAEAVGRLTG